MRRYSTILVLWAIICVYGLAVLPPEIVITSSPSSPVVGQTVTLNGSASYDPDGTIVSYSWTLPGQAFCMSGINTSIAKCKFDAAGTYKVTLTAQDNEGLYASEEYQVTITAATNTVWYVRPDGSDDNSGSVDSSSGAFRTIQTAIDSASTGDQIRVYGGIYYEQLHLKGKDVSIYSYNPANPGCWELAENTIIDANKQGTAVRYGGAESNSAELKGFTVRGGFPTGDSLALHLEFDDLNTIALDCSGKERNGIINGDPNRVAGYDGLVNGALEFNGNDWIQIEGYKGVAGKHPRSCAMWVKTSTVNTEMMLLTWGKEATAQKWQLFISSSNKLALGIWGGRLESTRTITDGNWHHVAAIFEGNGAINIRDVKLYIDGIQETTTCSNYVTTPPDINTELDGNVYIGARTGENPLYYTGVMDDVRIYSRTLGNAEVKIMSQAPVSLVHLKLDGNASDASGNQHYGTVEGDPNWINSGRIYGALDLDGAGDYITLSGGILNPAATAFSVFTWVRPSQATISTYQAIIQQFDEGTNLGRTLLLRTTDNKLSSSFGGSPTTTSQAIFTQAGQWYHVGVTYDGQKITLYVNGQEVVNTYKTAESCNGGWIIGRHKTDTTTCWNGAIDDLQIYKRVLTLDEIRQIAGHQEPVAHWTMDSISGSTIADNSLYNRSGTFSVASPTSTCSDGRLDNAISLQNNEYIRISGWNGVAGGSSRTTTAWVKTTPIPTASQMVYTWGNSANGEKWMFRVEPTGQIALGVWGGYVSGTTIVADGNWHHVAAVLNSDGTPTVGEVQLYVDGRLETVTSTNPSQAIITSTAENVLIGTQHQSGSYFNYYTGGLDDIRIYDRPLSRDEIQGLSGDIGLMAHWTLDETSSPSADSSGNAISGTWGGTPTSSIDGYLAGAMEFDGVSDYISTNYSGVLGNRDRTVSAWIKAMPQIYTAEAPILRSIVSWGGDTTGGTWNLAVNYVQNEGPYGTIRLAANYSKVIGTTRIDDNCWHHVAAVFANDGTPTVSDIQLYIDGKREVLSYSVDATLNTGTGFNVNIGAMKYQSNDPMFYFKGKIDDVRIYDRALSDADLWQMYQASVGGGIRGYGSLAQISECIITQNKSIVDGGGFSNSTVNMDSCKIIKNTTDAKGGGLYCRSGVVTNCIFSENHANTPYSEYAYGGGIHIDWSLSGVLIKDTYFIDNETMGHGGAVSTYCPVDFVNCVFYANKTTVGGGGAIAFWNSVNINSCTFTRNESQAGTIRNSSLYNSQIRNSILYGNLGGYVIYDPISSAYQSNLDISYSVIEGGLNGFYCFGRLLTGSNNLSNNPSFVDIFSPAGPDGEFKTCDDGLYFADDGPCLDAGDNSAIYESADIAGEARKSDSPYVNDTGNGVAPIVDIGAYEQCYVVVPNVIDMSQAQAELAITNADLSVGLLIPGSDPTIIPGNIISQSPTSGSYFKKGAQVHLIVSSSAAYYPNITDGQTDVSTDIILQWVAGSGASSSMVYLGTDYNVVANAVDPNAVTTESVFTPDQLQANTTYYWRVDQVGQYGTVTGTIWSFTTGTPEIIYVNWAVSGGSHDGSSWDNAYADLQTAMERANSDDQIWIAHGKYYPSKKMDPSDPRSASFVPKEGIKIYGGFTGIETSINQNNVENNHVILSGDIGISGDIADNCYHVVTYNGNHGGVISLNGVIVSDGNASNAPDDNQGGGAIYLNTQYSSLELNECKFLNNTGYIAGAILYTGSASINHCKFINNFSDMGNSINSYGGAIQFRERNVSDVVNIYNTSFYNNHANQGGAIFSYVDVALVNCDFIDNACMGGGGAVFIYEGFSEVINCTFKNNDGGIGGALFNYQADVDVINSIFWSNNAAYCGEIYNNNTVVAKNCNIQDGWNGPKCSSITNQGNNINNDPLFVSKTCVLEPSSPCIDSGDNGAIAGISLETDIYGAPRIIDGGNLPDGNPYVDIGAVEHLAGSLSIIYVKPEGSGDHTGFSWVHAMTLQEAIETCRANPDSVKQIWVAEGTYKPIEHLSIHRSDIDPLDPQMLSFYLPPNALIYGGFDGIDDTKETRDWRKYRSIISADIGIEGIASDDSKWLLVGRCACLDGFIVTGESTVDIWASEFHDLNIQINNCMFIGNIDLSIIGNILVENCYFAGNDLNSMYFCVNRDYCGINKIINSVFMNCVLNLDLEYLIVKNSVFERGGIQDYSLEQYYFTNCLFREMDIDIESDSRLVWLMPKDVSMLDNPAGGFYVESKYRDFEHCVIDSCNLNYRCGYTYDEDGERTVGSNYAIVNSIIFNETNISKEEGVDLSITYSNVEGGYNGIGNIDESPEVTIQGEVFAGIDAAKSNPDNCKDILGRVRYDDLSFSNRGYGTPNYADMGCFEKNGDGDWDNDGMNDFWEKLNYLDCANPNDASENYDKDTKTNIEEYNLGWKPLWNDADFDSIPDTWEISNGLDPLDYTDAYEDYDEDDIPNYWEYLAEMNPNSPDDAAQTRDGHLYTNIVEYVFGYNPKIPCASQSLDISLVRDGYVNSPSIGSWMYVVDPTVYPTVKTYTKDGRLIDEQGPIVYYLNKSATVTIKIKRADISTWDNPVVTVEMGQLSTGKQLFIWDGTDSNEYIVDKGYYDIKIIATSGTEVAQEDSSELLISPYGHLYDQIKLKYSYDVETVKNIPLKIYAEGNPEHIVTIEIVDGSGQNIKTLVKNELLLGYDPYSFIDGIKGCNTIYWDGRDNNKQIHSGDFDVRATLSSIAKRGLIMVCYPDLLANFNCDPYRIRLRYGQVSQIAYTLEYKATVDIKIYSPLDNTTPVWTTLYNQQDPGNYQVAWNGKDQNGGYVATEGMYRVEMSANFGNHTKTVYGSITVYE